MGFSPPLIAYQTIPVKSEEEESLSDLCFSEFQEEHPEHTTVSAAGGPFFSFSFAFGTNVGGVCLCLEEMDSGNARI
ncbi:hypothetical protein PFLUV_G00029710 [Perca fluviatilis]|uniref:Uncharacterized protein n=1 Tax=Perca fluviatilis TaxID=8168 RepID=A0A6A5FLJ4_PERFL|nr:hypothetical protein PFLUV_G00029710 [Perca fluviatilis]